MEQGEKGLPPRPQQSTYPDNNNQEPLNSRNHWGSAASGASRPTRGATYPEPSTLATSTRPGENGRSTAVAVEPSSSVAGGRTRSHQASVPKFISRKPVERRGTSGSSTTINARSVSHPEDHTRNSQLVPPNTIMLFNQASRSLTNLAQGVNDVDIQDNADSPPPYGDTPPPSSPVADMKQQPPQRELSANLEPPDAIQLIRENRVDLLQQMLEQGLIINDVDATTRRTAIMEAANLRRSAAAGILIRSGYRLHLKDINGFSALHFAASQGDAEICQMLLDGGAQLDEYNNDGDSPLTLAARGGHTDVVLCLLNSWAAQMSSGASLLNGFLEAVKSGNVRTAEVFVERGINPKKVQDSWRPPIYAGKSTCLPRTAK